MGDGIGSPCLQPSFRLLLLSHLGNVDHSDQINSSIKN